METRRSARISSKNSQQIAATSSGTAVSETDASLKGTVTKRKRNTKATITGHPEAAAVSASPPDIPNSNELLPGAAVEQVVQDAPSSDISGLKRKSMTRRKAPSDSQPENVSAPSTRLARGSRTCPQTPASDTSKSTSIHGEPVEPDHSDSGDPAELKTPGKRRTRQAKRQKVTDAIADAALQQTISDSQDANAQGEPTPLSNEAVVEPDSKRRRSSRLESTTVNSDPQSSSAPEVISSRKAKKKSPVRKSNEKQVEQITDSTNESIDKPSVEPATCTRCNLKKAGMTHFYRVHNGLLAEQQESWEVDLKRKQWAATIKAGYKLRCQRSECKKELGSVPAILYHENVCGKEAVKQECPTCKRKIASSWFDRHVASHDRPVTVSEDPDAKYRKQIEYVSPSTEAPGTRSGRQSARACAQKLSATMKESDDDEEVADLSEPESNYADAQSSSSESADDDGSVEEVSSEAGSDASVDHDSQRGAQKVPIRFTPTDKFPTLQSYWTAAFENAGFAVCRVGDCTYLSTSLEQCRAHHYECLKKQVHRNRIGCHYCPRARMFTLKSGLIRHYMKFHQMKESQATKLAELPKPSVQQKTLAKCRPTQAEIDALHLFD